MIRVWEDRQIANACVWESVSSIKMREKEKNKTESKTIHDSNKKKIWEANQSVAGFSVESRSMRLTAERKADTERYSLVFR